MPKITRRVIEDHIGPDYTWILVRNVVSLQQYDASLKVLTTSYNATDMNII